MTQAGCHPPAKAMMDGASKTATAAWKALRILKRRLSDVIYTVRRADLPTAVAVAAA